MLDKSMDPADVRAYVESELHPFGIDGPTLLLDLYRLAIEVHIRALDEDRGVPASVHLLGNGNGIPLQTFSYKEIRDFGGHFGQRGEAENPEVDKYSWFIFDCDIAVALAQLLVNNPDIEAAHMIGPDRRYDEALKLIRQVERDGLTH